MSSSIVLVASSPITGTTFPALSYSRSSSNRLLTGLSFALASPLVAQSLTPTFSASSCAICDERASSRRSWRESDAAVGDAVSKR